MKKINRQKLASRAQRIVLKYVERIPGIKNWKSDYILIQCPYHIGDNTPSCKINIAPSDYAPVGFMYCWGCEEKGHWNEKIADKFGFPHISKSDAKQDHVTDRDSEDMRRKLLSTEEFRSLDKHLANDCIISIPYPSNSKWRGIEGSLLSLIGSRLFLDRRDQQRLIALPVCVDGDTVGYIKAKMQKKKGDISYINQEGEWAKSTGLFPFDTAKKLARKKGIKTLTLVEGPRDALKLIQQGIPAVAILGTKNWSREKMEILQNNGFERFVICMDSDFPGRLASRRIRRMMQHKVKFTDYTQRLRAHAEKTGKDIDPATLTPKLLKGLRKAVLK